MSNIEQAIEKTKYLLDFSNYNVGRFAKIFPFSNENLVGCFQKFDFSNKTCLTVMGSSDQAFDMFLNGAKVVHAFDSNLLTEYYFYLKRAALLAGFTYEDFLAFFTKNYDTTGSLFSLKSFLILKKYLPEAALSFWDYLFSNYSSKKIRLTGLFSHEEMNVNTLINTVNYLNSDNYLTLQKKAKELEISFFHQNFQNLNSSLSQHYDYIYLSNIIQYADEMYLSEDYLRREEKQENSLFRFRNDIYKLYDFLKEDGMVIAGYLYQPGCESNRIAIFNSYLRNQIFTVPNFYYNYFTSIHEINAKMRMKFTSECFKDACLIYKKED